MNEEIIDKKDLLKAGKAETFFGVKAENLSRDELFMLIGLQRRIIDIQGEELNKVVDHFLR